MSQPSLDASQVPPAVRDVMQGLEVAGHRAFLVGGCVRDLLRGKTPKDWDLATSARPEQVQAAFKKVIPTGVEHGTVTVLVKGVHVEVTTFRTEGAYVDGRRPSSVSFVEEIEADLGRRDFTINAMAWRPQDRGVVDPWGGQADLSARVVRCVRDARERFDEDGLRALRAVRFATVLDFEIDPATLAAVGPTLGTFRKLARERIHQELVKIVLAPHAARGLGLLAQTGLLGSFFPEAVGADFEAVGRAPAELAPRLALLLGDAGQTRDVLLALKFPVKVATDAAHLVQHRKLPPGSATDAELRRWLARVAPSHATPLLAMAEARGEDVTAIKARVAAIVAARPPLMARDLALNGLGIMAALGVGPSPVVGEATRALVDAVLEDPARNTPEALRDLLGALFPQPR